MHRSFKISYSRCTDIVLNRVEFDAQGLSGVTMYVLSDLRSIQVILYVCT